MTYKSIMVERLLEASREKINRLQRNNIKHIIQLFSSNNAADKRQWRNAYKVPKKVIFNLKFYTRPNYHQV